MNKLLFTFLVLNVIFMNLNYFVIAKSKDKNPLTNHDPFHSAQFVKIPAGFFLMGSPSWDRYRDIDENQVYVEITKDFEIMETEVTQNQWYKVKKNNPSFFKYPGDCDNHLVVKDQSQPVNMCPDHPVERVSWMEVQEFVNELNNILGLIGCDGTPHSAKGCYRLPTEAEWERAVRAGINSIHFFGNDPALMGVYAWHVGNSGGKYFNPELKKATPADGTHKVKTKSPNYWGLYDMYGNVWEFTNDSYRAFLYGGEDPLVVRGDCFTRDECLLDRIPDAVIRGGSCCYGTSYLRSATRSPIGVNFKNSFIGFRLVRQL